MRVRWLGQAGIILDDGNTKIIVDPYLSNSVEKIQPKNFRRVPINNDIFDIEPDIMIFTHDHLDHYDPDTVSFFLGRDRKPVTVLCPNSVWKKAREFGGDHNYVLFDRHSEWTEKGYRFCAVKAAHSDPFAIGVVIKNILGDRVYYITGDTLYNSEIFKDLPINIDVIFVPINGVGNNMNSTDAKRFCNQCGAKSIIPYHIGMFDDYSSDIFDAENKIVLEPYKEKEI